MIIRCCSCWRSQRSSNTIIINDNCCQCHYAGLKLQSGLEDNDILVASYCNDVSIMSYILFDRLTGD